LKHTKHVVFVTAQVYDRLHIEVFALFSDVASFYHPQKSNIWKLLLASQSRQRGYCNVVEDAGNFKSFDESLLKYLVCPLTKEPLK